MENSAPENRNETPKKGRVEKETSAAIFQSTKIEKWTERERVRDHRWVS